MVRKINLKKANLTRKGYVDIREDIVLPISTVGDITLQNILTKFDSMMVIPKAKTRVATKEEILILNEAGYEINKRPFMIQEIDRTTAEYSEYIKKRNQFEALIFISANVDLDYNISSRKKLWQHLELESKDDYIGFNNFLIELDLAHRCYMIYRLVP